METLKNIILLFIPFIFITVTASGQEANLKPYYLKSGIIEYSYSGDKTGKGTLYFDDYGIKSALFTDAIEHGDMKRSWVITSGNYQYMWDADSPDKGMKLKNPITGWAATAPKKKSIQSQNRCT